MNRRDFLMASSAMLAQPIIPVFAGSKKPTGKLYFGYGATGIGSIIGRAATDLLYKIDPDYDYQFINDPRQNTIAATEIVKESVANGEIILQATSTIMSLFTCLYRNLPYDSISDFAPVAFLGEYTYMLVVGPLVDNSVNTVDDYIQWVFDNPEYSNFGTVLYGSETHLAGLTLAQDKKIALRAQVYGGTSLMVEDLSDGVLAAGFVITGNAKGEIAEKRLRVLGVCSSERHAPLSDVPTLKEQGVYNMDFRGWYAWMAPSEISHSKLIKLSRAVKKMHKNAEFRELQSSLLLSSLDLSPTEIQQRIRRETKKCKELYEKFQLSKISYVS
ncbi:tripartite tricarboxylate transporter substrate-binding protein [Gammaproteobacteria bacterium AS21]